MSTVHELYASTETVRVGAIDAAHPPVLTVSSGDEVILSTWTAWGNGVTPATTLKDVERLRSQPGLIGSHTLTGPIDVRGAQPGDVLRVDFLELQTTTHGYNVRLPGVIARGALAARFATGDIRHFKLDPVAMTVVAASGLTLALRPFLGILGVAPEEPGPHPSSIPGRFGGNIDLTDLVVGTTLRLPVLRPGAGFYAGDAHALQGDGEVNQTALETAMSRARLRLLLERDHPLRWPQAETAAHVITLAVDEDLDVAAQIATEEAVELIARRRRIHLADAYVLASLTVDLAVTQIVNAHKGVHAKIPKSVLV